MPLEALIESASKKYEDELNDAFVFEDEMRRKGNSILPKVIYNAIYKTSYLHKVMSTNNKTMRRSAFSLGMLCYSCSSEQ